MMPDRNVLCRASAICSSPRASKRKRVIGVRRSGEDSSAPDAGAHGALAVGSESRLG